MKEYIFKFPIEDWNKSGHEKVEWYMVKSNKPV